MGAMQQALMCVPTAAPVSYLDGLATLPRAVCSLRKLVSTATLCCRVRNATTGVETDVGFSGSAIDTAALSATYSAGQDVTVAKWYDQTGNAEHLENATAASQPLIVSAGTYLGHVSFDGTSRYMAITSLSLGAPQVGLYAKFQYISAAGNRVKFELTTVASSNAGSFLIYKNNDGLEYVDSYNSSGANDRARRYANEAALGQYTYLLDRSIVGATEIMAYKNGAARTVISEAASVEQVGNYLTSNFYVCSRAGSSSFAQMALETLVIYDADTAAIRTSIEPIVS